MPDHTMTAPRSVDASIARSWLLVNGARPDTFDRAHRSGADQLVLDIEDAVDPTLKTRAREDVAGWLENHSAWVRINDRGTPYWSGDVDRLAELPHLAGVVLAKAEAAEHVTETFDRLGRVIPVLALVESAVGIENAPAIARARGAFRLAFGSGDYRRDTGASADDLAMAYPRSRLVVASRVGDLPGPIDGPTVGNSHLLLREQTTHAVSLGLTGKLCLDTDQLDVINEAISPAPSEVSWAQEFLADFQARGRVIRDGSDLPRLGRARKLVQLAEAFTISPA
ncbi:CoA ester lyase [Rhodococcus sp. WS4]|nr:CoA ester lyase [Rhodococcus sp. WS4]